MKSLKLSREHTTRVSDVDFDYLNKWKWSYAMIGSNNHRKPYAIRTTNSPKKTIYLHRVIAGTPKGMFTDHINGNTLDNRRSNLRICSYTVNNQNRLNNKNNTSGYKGVVRHGNGWKAQIGYKGKRLYIGHFHTALEASLAYKNAVKKYHVA